MGRLTLAVRLKPEPNRDGEHVIRIRITKDRAISFWALNMALPEKHFNEKATKDLANWVRKTYRDHKLYNGRILEAYQQAEEAAGFFEKRGQDYSPGEMKAYLEQGGYPDKLFPFFASHVSERRLAAGADLGKMQTADSYESTLRVLRLYTRHLHRLSAETPDSALDERYWQLGQLTKKDMLDLKGWLQANYAQNSVNTYLGKLRHVLYQAAEAGLVSFERFPMRGIGGGTVRKKVARLREEEVDALAREAAPKKHLGGRLPVTDVEHARSLALAMYLAHGARLGDAVLWRVENYVIEGHQHRLRYTTSKNKKPMSVLLDEQAIQIMAPYRLTGEHKPRPGRAFLFPYLPGDFDQLSAADQFVQLRRAKMRARQQMARLGERIGLEKRITPHVMRHSFADMLRRSGVQLETRQEALGHSDIKTTRSYEEQFDQEALDQISQLYARHKKPENKQQ